MSKPDIRFVFTAKRSTYGEAGTLNFSASAQYLNETGEVRNPQFTDSDPLVAPLSYLAIKGYFSSEIGWYGYDVGYSEPWYVELKEAEMMVKQLRKIGKALDRFETQFGHAHDLPAFCGRVAQAVGCTSADVFGEYHDEMQFNGTRYRWRDVDGLRWRLDELAKHAKDPTYRMAQ